MTNAEAVEEANGSHNTCEGRSPQRFWCTRLPNHDGEHIACTTTRVIERWDNERAVVVGFTVSEATALVMSAQHAIAEISDDESDTSRTLKSAIAKIQQAQPASKDIK